MASRSPELHATGSGRQGDPEMTTETAPKKQQIRFAGATSDTSLTAPTSQTPKKAVRFETFNGITDVVGCCCCCCCGGGSGGGGGGRGGGGDGGGGGGGGVCVCVMQHKVKNRGGY